MFVLPRSSSCAALGKDGNLHDLTTALATACDDYDRHAKELSKKQKE